MTRSAISWRLIWLGVTIAVLIGCLLFHGVDRAGRENAAAAYGVSMTMLAFPTSLLARLTLIAVDSVLARVSISMPALGSIRDFALEWAVGLAAGYIQWFVLIPALRRRLRFARSIGDLPRLARVGIGIMISGLTVFGLWILWAETRTVVPVDMPVSLSSGREYTREFKVNLQETYTIGIEVRKSLPFDELVCLLGVNTPSIEPCSNTPSVVKERWILTSNGSMVAQGSSDEDKGGDFMNDKIGREIGSFDAVKGRRYKLTVSVLADGDRLATCNPHLRVAVHPMYNEGSGILGFFVVCGTTLVGLVGVVLVFVSTRRHAAEAVAPLSQSTPS